MVYELTLDPARWAGDDKTPAMREALESIPPGREAVLRITPGDWHCWPDRSAERHYFVSNNDHGLKRIAFPLLGTRDLTIDGQGARLVFHGPMTPFVLDGADHVTLRNLTIDYDRPFFTQGTITAAAADYVDLRIDRERYPCGVVDGRLVFSGDNWDGLGFRWMMLMVQFRPDTGDLQPAMRYHIGRFESIAHIDRKRDSWSMPLVAEDRPDGVVRIRGAWGEGMVPGNWLALGHAHRHNPAILVTGSTGVRIENVTIHHAQAMGVIAQLSRDIALDGVCVVPPPDSDRVVSAVADATHFVNCEGTVSLENCRFENMLDDGTNIHGIYTTVSRMPARDRLELELMHFQQHGVDLYRPGDQLAFVDRDTLQPVGHATVRSGRLLNRRFLEVCLEEAADPAVTVGCAVDNITRYPEITLRGCSTGHNRPRGFLVTSNRRTVIEDNTFYNSSAGVSVTGDANYWFEAGPVGDLVIRNNRFLDCGYADGAPAIVVSPEVPAKDHAPCYHRGIRIENNHFETHGRPALFARSVEGLQVRGNTYADPPARNLVLEGCRNGDVSD